MTNFNLTTMPPLEDYEILYNSTCFQNVSTEEPINPSVETTSFIVFVSVICLFGVLGNGTVIRLLGFHLKRNPLTTYILNLAVADFGVLISLFLIVIFFILHRVNQDKDHFYLFWLGVMAVELFLFMYNTSQFILAAISIGRCISVIFPIWHRLHRPPHLSAIVCFLIWVLSLLIGGIEIYFFITKSFAFYLLMYVQFLINVLFCLPLITISTSTLFINVCFKLRQHQRGTLLTAILMVLLFFLLFAFPLHAFCIVYSIHGPHPYLIELGLLCISLNSCVNPVIYFLVGRQKRGQAKENMKVMLYRIFKEAEEGGGENLGPTHP